MEACRVGLISKQPFQNVQPIRSVEVRRTFDAAFLNDVANHSAVRPTLEGEGVLDLAGLIANPANIALVSEFGGFVLAMHEPGRYEVHSLFLPGHRSHPTWAMLAAQEWVFTRTDCESIVSKVPHSNERAKGFAIAGGLRTIFERDEAAYVEITAMDWAMRSAGLEEHGERFHDFLGSATHDHDTAHERAVGAALLMIERGQAPKGVGFYNRWARLAGYAPISLVSLSPVTVDVVDAVLGMGMNGMEVLMSRSAK